VSLVLSLQVQHLITVPIIQDHCHSRTTPSSRGGDEYGPEICAICGVRRS